MKIEFETADLTAAEATGLIALMAAIHGEGIIPTPADDLAIAPEGATGPVVINRIERAPDGYPTPADDLAIAPEGATVAASSVPARDSAGIPWDERIHASTKTTTANGQWTRRRNTPDATFDAVMAELKAANTAMTLAAAEGLTAPSGPVIGGAPEDPPASKTHTEAAEAFAPPASVVIPPHVPTPPAPPVPPAPTAAPDDAPPFLTIMQLVTAKQRDGKLDQAKLAELLAAVGLDAVPKLISAPADVRANFHALVTAA